MEGQDVIRERAGAVVETMLGADLWYALERVEKLARKAQTDLSAGRATSGHAALRKIETEAQDARRWSKVAPSSAVGATIEAT